MSLNTSLQLTIHFLAFALALQAGEIYFLGRNPLFLKIWSLENLKPVLKSGLPFSDRAINILFSTAALKYIALLQILISISVFFNPCLLFFLILFITHLLICIRFRGTFNGGSDMMTFVILTGVLISLFKENSQKWGLIYISIHTLYSYFKAGLAKAIETDWRSGKALPAFLERSLFLDIKSIGMWLGSKNYLSFVFCWCILVYELSIISLLVFPHLVLFYFLISVLFHFIIYLSFGLNRFFWIWLAAWPAVFYSLGLV